MKRFDRKYQVTFGQRNGTLKQISELRIKFKVEKSPAKNANTANIEIYNLSESSRNLFQNDDPVILLSAGYNEKIGGIFAGDVSKVEHKYDSINGDVITVIQAGDGEKALQKSTVSKSYIKGTKITNVVQDVISSFTNVSFSQNLSGVIPAAAELVTGGSFEGQSDNILSELLSSFGLDFSIQDNELIVAGNPALNETGIQVVSRNTGLIGSPSKTENGIALSMLLEASIRPGSIMKVESKFITGNYKATKVIYDGDNFNNNWYNSMEAEPV